MKVVLGMRKRDEQHFINSEFALIIQNGSQSIIMFAPDMPTARQFIRMMGITQVSLRYANFTPLEETMLKEYFGR